jgi:hypothetical protein
MMQGIWNLSTQLVGSSFRDKSALARIVCNVIFIPGIVYVVFAWSKEQRKKRGADPFDAIGYGASALLLWYILNTIDLFLHESQISAKYSYILYYFFLACLKFPADILILAGSQRIISGQLYIHHPKRTPKPVIWLLTGEFLVIILMILALYYIGSLLTYEVLWLQVADASVVLSVGTRRNKMETAFFVIQFLLTLLTLAAASFSFWFSKQENPFIPNQTFRERLSPLTAIFATSLIFIRSISELTVVVRYQLLSHPYTRSTLPARDLIYGLTTLSFLLLIPTIAHEIAAAEAAETRDPVLTNMEEDTRRTITRKIEEYKNRFGGKVPSMQGVLVEVRNDFVGCFSGETTASLNRMTRDQGRELGRMWVVYVRGLQEKYGELEERDRSREF